MGGADDDAGIDNVTTQPFSYQSLMPAGAGTPRYEKLELWLGTEKWHGEFCRSPPRPLRGTSPRATFFRGLREAD